MDSIAGNMNNASIVNELNSVKRLSDRFAIVRESPKDMSPCNNCQKFCIADYKVLMCTINTASMDKNYNPFLIQGTPKLTQEEMHFIEQHRIGKIIEPLMKGYYCDVFCNAQDRKNRKYANIIIESYLLVISNPDAFSIGDCLWIWKSLMYNSKTYKCHIDEVTSAIDLYLTLDVPMHIKFYLLVNAYNFQFFNGNEIFAIVSKYSLLDSISDLYTANKSFFEMLLKCVPGKEKDATRKINHRLAENEDIIIRQHPIDKTATADILCKYEYLKKAGLESEAEECYKLFIQAKSSKEGYGHYENDIQIPNELVQPFIELISNNPDPLRILAESDDILPPIEDGVSLVSEEFGRLGISAKVTDINGNPHPDNGQVMKIDYNCFYNIITIFPLKLSLVNLISRKAFDEEGIVEYLNSTWLGEPRVPVNPTLARTQESWVDSIRPSLHLINRAVINELEGKKSNVNEYICPVDSLTLKIEGCLRDVCRRLGIPTVREKDHYEVSLEDVINKINEYQNEKGISILSSRSINMLKKLLTNDNSMGLNLRNNISHGFTGICNYSMGTALTVIHCILRISSIKFSSSISTMQE